MCRKRQQSAFEGCMVFLKVIYAYYQVQCRQPIPLSKTSIISVGPNASTYYSHGGWKRGNRSVIGQSMHRVVIAVSSWLGPRVCCSDQHTEYSVTVNGFILDFVYIYHLVRAERGVTKQQIKNREERKKTPTTQQAFFIIRLNQHYPMHWTIASH